MMNSINFLVTWLGVSMWPQVVLQLAMAGVLAWFIIGELRQRPLSGKILVWIIVGYIGLSLVAGTWGTIATYQAWRADTFTKHFLPPYQSWNYFINHVWIFMFEPLVFQLGFTSVWAGLLWIAKKYSHDSLFDNKEIWLALATSIGIVWPVGFVYVALTVGFMLINWVVIYIKKRSSEIYVKIALPMLVAGIVSILATKFLLKWLWLVGIRI